MNYLRIVSTIIALCIGQFLFANYDEAVDGDLSDDPQNPTMIQVADGSNIVCASSIAGDVEFFTITVPAGGTLDEIVLTSFNSVGVGFLAMQSGSVFDPSLGIAGMLGWTHLGQVSGAQLAGMNANGGIGFTIPLGPGDYSFWSQETSPDNATDYCLDFQMTIPPPPVSEIPTMGEWGLIILSLLMLIIGVSQISIYQQRRRLGSSH